MDGDFLLRRHVEAEPPWKSLALLDPGARERPALVGPLEGPMNPERARTLTHYGVTSRYYS